VLQNYPDSPTVEPVLFQMAYVQYDQVEGDYLAANEVYANKLDRGEDPGEAPLADYNTPIRTYNRFMRQYPNSDLTDQAYFQLGHLMSDQGDLIGSNQMFETLVQRHPDSPLVPDAYLRIGDFYFDAMYLGLTEMGGEELLVKLLLRHSVMALEVVSRGDPVPDAAGCRVLCQTLAKRRKFRCH
jgi:tetratricopeptide (TPR) repeat protein